MDLKIVPTLFILSFLIQVGYGEIRTYQPMQHVSQTAVPQVASSTPAVSNKDAQFKAKVEKMWGKLQAKYSNSNTDSIITVYIHTDDYQKDLNEGIRRTISATTVMAQPVPIQYYINDNGYGQDSMDVLLAMQDLGEQYEFNVDRDNDVAKAFNLERKSTIIYRDATGAIRLYSLAYEVDKLERQLKRQLEQAPKQP